MPGTKPSSPTTRNVTPTSRVRVWTSERSLMGLPPMTDSRWFVRPLEPVRSVAAARRESEWDSLAGLFEIREDGEHAAGSVVRRRQAQLLVDARDVLLRGADGHHECVFDPRVRAAPPHQAKDSALARRQPFDPFLAGDE